MSARQAALVWRPIAALVLSVALLVAWAISGGPGSARAAVSGASEPIRQFYDVLLNNMQNGAVLGAKGRFEKLTPVIGHIFDMQYMTRIAVGPAWPGISGAERQRVMDAFGRYVAATYANNFDRYSGQKLQVTDEQPRESGVIVDSRIVRADGSLVTIRYLMHDGGGAWRVADIYLSGTISEVAVRRSEFTSIIERQGVSGLIQMLEQKVDMLTAAAQ